MLPTRRLAAVALVGLIGLVGCGGDDDDAGTADLETYCERTVALDNAGEPKVDPTTASPEEVVAATKAFAGDTLLPIAEEIEGSAPPEVRDDTAVLRDAVEDAADTGDLDAAFATPDVEAARARLHEHDLASCGWGVVEVTATDYRFAGIPATLDAGVTSFELTNDGTELHELALVRKNDDTLESFDVLLAMPPDASARKVRFVAGAFAAPGGEDHVVADLEPGDYIAICFIPIGSVAEGAPAQGPPHFTEGMRQELTVS